MNIMTINALANLAIFTTSKNKITMAITKHVIAIVTTGVKYLVCILDIKSGNNLSIAMAKGNLEAASTPEFAIEINVITPTIAAIYPITFPPKRLAIVYIGLMSVFNSSNGRLPTRTNATTTYIVVIIKSDKIIALGKLTLGFLISPAMAATLVTPA